MSELAFRANFTFQRYIVCASAVARLNLSEPVPYSIFERVIIAWVVNRKIILGDALAGAVGTKGINSETCHMM
jgi:hypothetical protein